MTNLIGLHGEALDSGFIKLSPKFQKKLETAKKELANPKSETAKTETAIYKEEKEGKITVTPENPPLNNRTETPRFGVTGAVGRSQRENQTKRLKEKIKKLKPTSHELETARKLAAERQVKSGGLVADVAGALDTVISNRQTKRQQSKSDIQAPDLKEKAAQAIKKIENATVNSEKFKVTAKIKRNRLQERIANRINQTITASGVGKTITELINHKGERIIRLLEPSTAALAHENPQLLRKEQVQTSTEAAKLRTDIRTIEKNLAALKKIKNLSNEKGTVLEKFTTKKTRAAFDRDIEKQKALLSEKKKELQDADTHIREIQSIRREGKHFLDNLNSHAIELEEAKSAIRGAMRFISPKRIAEDTTAFGESLQRILKPTSTITELKTIGKSLMSPITGPEILVGAVILGKAGKLTKTESAPKEYKVTELVGKAELTSATDLTPDIIPVIDPVSGGVLGILKSKEEGVAKKSRVFVSGARERITNKRPSTAVGIGVEGIVNEVLVGDDGVRIKRQVKNARLPIPEKFTKINIDEATKQKETIKLPDKNIINEVKKIDDPESKVFGEYDPISGKIFLSKKELRLLKFFKKPAFNKVKFHEIGHKISIEEEVGIPKKTSHINKAYNELVKAGLVDPISVIERDYSKKDVIPEMNAEILGAFLEKPKKFKQVHPYFYESIKKSLIDVGIIKETPTFYPNILRNKAETIINEAKEQIKKAKNNQEPVITIKKGDKRLIAKGKKPPEPQITGEATTPETKAYKVYDNNKLKGIIFTTEQELDILGPLKTKQAAQIRNAKTHPVKPEFQKGRPAITQPHPTKTGPGNKIPILKTYRIQPFKTKKGTTYKLIEEKPFRAKPTKKGRGQTTDNAKQEQVSVNINKRPFKNKNERVIINVEELPQNTLFNGKTGSLIGASLSLGNKEETINAIKSNSALGYSLNQNIITPIPKISEITKNVYKTRTTPIIQTTSEATQNTLSKTKTKTITNVKTKQSTHQQKQTKTISTIKIPSEKPLKNFKLIPHLKKINHVSVMKNEKAYNVAVRLKGKYVKVNQQPLPRFKALNFGAALVDKTASATFKLSPITNKNNAEVVDDIFYSYRRKFRHPKKGGKNVFIEKRKFRIDSEGEKKQITRKGLLTLAHNRRIDNIKEMLRL